MITYGKDWQMIFGSVLVNNHAMQSKPFGILPMVAARLASVVLEIQTLQGEP